MERIIDVFTDGAVSGNPGPGGAAAIVNDYINNIGISIGTFEKETTNQRMELKGILIGLYQILDDHTVLWHNNDLITVNIFSDSAYCVRAFNEGWLNKWQTNGWKNSKKEPVANQELWKRILEAIKDCNENNIKVNFFKVKGHSDVKYNNMADEVAVYCSRRQTNYSSMRKLGDSE